MRFMRRARRRGERGAVAIEAALVTPILFLFIFGIIEMSFLLRDYITVTNDTRVGARIAATGAGAGYAQCETGPLAPPCAPQSTPNLAQNAANAIQLAGSAMNPDNINYVLIYKANAQGYPGADGNTTMPTNCTATANCVRFTWRDSSNQFFYAGGSWLSSTINACFPGSVDRVGIYLNATHPMLTGILGNSVTMTDHTVMDFEPLATETCASGKHP